MGRRKMDGSYGTPSYELGACSRRAEVVVKAGPKQDLTWSAAGGRPAPFWDDLVGLFEDEEDTWDAECAADGRRRDDEWRRQLKRNHRGGGWSYENFTRFEVYDVF